MKPPLFVRPLTDEERHHLEDGLRSKQAFTLRRCQILLASAQRHPPAQIAKAVGCRVHTSATPCTASHSVGWHASRRSPASHTRSSPCWTPPSARGSTALSHQSPRTFDKPRSTWTLALLAEVCCDLGLSPQPLSAPTIRDAIRRLGANWKRAKHWITSPDPAYVRKKTDVTA